MYSADHRGTILPILRHIRVATIRELVAFATVFCGRINLPEDSSLWSPKARTPVLPGHNIGQRTNYHDLLSGAPLHICIDLLLHPTRYSHTPYTVI